MDIKESPTKNWAILVGINFYVNDRPLKGCVRDVEAIEHYLSTGTGSNEVDVVTFIAGKSTDIDLQSSQEQPGQLPTYENVTNSLARVVKFSRPGDLVYFHFSGHGTRNPQTGALALVLVDQQHGTRYLHGQLLASMLERMTEKGLFVTLVLDCCFSGSKLRFGNSDNTSVRTTKYNPAIDMAYPTEEYPWRSSFGSGPWRDAHPLPQWLLHPNYSLLTACGPHEIAEELEVETTNGQTNVRRGALSYFLLEALISLRRSGVEVSQSSLYQHLLTKFHIHWPHQTPMRRGNENISFFGKLQFAADLLFIPISKTDRGCICLEAGHVHDVHKGDEYALSPFNVSERTSDQNKTSSLRFRVDHVSCFTSELVPLDSTYAIDQVGTGWKATLITRFPAWSISVRIFRGAKNKDQWSAAAAKISWLRLITEDEETRHCLFNVLCDPPSEYEILDASYNKIPGLPSIPVAHEGAIEHVIETLQHLARFKRFEGIVNRAPSTSFERSFTISSDSQKGASDYCHIYHGDEWPFCVENFGKKPLYLTIFDLCPSGRIKNVMSESGVDFVVIEPSEKYVGSLRMQVPDDLKRTGCNECEDVMKFFIVNRATCFPTEILPKMTEATQRLNKGTRGIYDLDPLSGFLSVLESRFRGANDETWIDYWASYNYIVRTTAG